MKLRKLILSLAVVLGCISVSAQEAEGTTEYVFQPHWYGQLQVGGQETLGETSFGKLLTFNSQIGVGYQFTPVWGLRLSVNGWQSKASVEYDNAINRWKWNYVAPMADVTLDLSNLIAGFNPNRVVSVGVFAGIGANFGFKNDEAVAINNAISKSGFNVLGNIWDGTKVRLVGRVGANVDFRVSEKVKLGIELQANTLNDNYNSKLARNADWYFNGYVGIKYTFGKSYSKRFVPAPKPEVVIQERIVEKIVEVPAPVKEVVKQECPRQPLARDIFFTIANTKISLWEMQKVQEIADYLKANPGSTVKVTGYADKGTGTEAINLRLAKQRAQVVVDALINKYGIDPSRISSASMTDHNQQPFTVPELNRVAICVAE